MVGPPPTSINKGNCVNEILIDTQLDIALTSLPVCMHVCAHTHTHTHTRCWLGNSTVLAFHMFHTFSSSYTGIQACYFLLKARKETTCFWKDEERKKLLSRAEQGPQPAPLWAGRLWVSLCNWPVEEKAVSYHHRLDPRCRSLHFARDSQFTHGLEAAEVRPEWTMETGTVEISGLTSVREDKCWRSLPNTSTPHKPCTLLDPHFCRVLLWGVCKHPKHTWGK